MKLALITDTHFGARNDNIGLLDHFKKFLDNVFFPHLEQHNIRHVIHLGDLVDRRKYINVNTKHRIRKDFLERIMWNHRELHIIAGNHDCYYKDTNEVNSLEELRYDGVYVYTEPHTVVIGEDKPGRLSPKVTVRENAPYPWDIEHRFLFLPWICDANREESLRAIQETDAPICFGHLELAGFEMHKGSFSETGQESSLFDKFDIVCSGHFHHKSTYQNINYLGSPWEMTWADYGDTKGFHVFDTDTRELTFIENPYKLFNKVVYDDEGKTFEDIMGQNLSNLKDTYVKVIVKSKSNPYWFDQFINRLESLPVLNVQAVDDHLNLNLENDEDIIDQAESTIEILQKSIKQISIKEEYEKPLTQLLYDLYSQANIMNA